ncbi:hypothetical protein MHLP_01205 [Candidatus Mycoplasma haematolamae str. Purdue]|uniref:Uncharacterized protein n=1 Tax=Mycoplasma haematolamae (strain Purdue) TaxID=1212765 RepID=I7CEX8_MYCHA|nr:hypothetical protein [Candidatus Mycoplasma haematolamae]AFO51821.1 hypothetical protein MHLP_01205 [Candidatus Mycoplasma haematolamae str. Purdue]
MGYQKLAATVASFLVAGSVGGTTLYTQLPVEQVEQKIAPEPPRENTYTFKFNDQTYTLKCRDGYLPIDDAEVIHRGNIKLSIACTKIGGRYVTSNVLNWKDYQQNRQGIKCQSNNKGELDYTCTFKGNQPTVRAATARYIPADSYKKEILLIN